MVTPAIHVLLLCSCVIGPLPALLPSTFHRLGHFQLYER